MDEQLDSRLSRVASSAPHPALHAIDTAILDRIAHERVGRAHAFRLDAVAFAGALVLGVASSIAFSTPPTGATNTSLNGLTPLAPSSLLERAR